MTSSPPKSLIDRLAKARHAKERAEFWERVFQGRLADALVPAKEIEQELKKWGTRRRAAEKRIAKLESRGQGGSP